MEDGWRHEGLYLDPLEDGRHEVRPDRCRERPAGDLYAAHRATANRILETTLTLLVAAGLLLAAGSIWLLIRGFVYAVRSLQGEAAPARHKKPRQQILPRFARRAGIVSGVLIRGGRLVVTLVQFAAAHIYARVLEMRASLQDRRSLDGLGSPALFPGSAEILLHPKSPYLPPRFARARTDSNKRRPQI